jgi:hypothetical protein
LLLDSRSYEKILNGQGGTGRGSWAMAGADQAAAQPEWPWFSALLWSNIAA